MLAALSFEGETINAPKIGMQWRNEGTEQRGKMDSNNVQQKLYNQHKTAAIGNHFWYKLKLYYNILLARLRDGAKPKTLSNALAIGGIISVG